MTKIQFELDGKQVEANAGETIWQVANRQGREIPHLCYSPAPDYRPDGNCRACMVEIEGERVLAASCKRTPSVGMKVKTASARAVAAQKMVMELLVADQPARQTSHDPESKFWHWAEKVEVTESRSAASAARSPIRSRTRGSSTPRAAMARPITTGSVSRDASVSITSTIRIVF